MQKIRGLLVNLLVMFIAILIPLVIFESVLRFEGISCSVVNEKGEGMFSFQNGTYEMKSSYTGRHRCLEFDTTISTNSLGYRDDEFDNSKDAVLIIGDSMVYGQGVEHNETFAYLLKEDLSVYNLTTYNLGTPGYSMDGYINTYKKFQQNPFVDSVVLVIYEGNDIQESCGIINRTSFFSLKRTGAGAIKDTLKRLYSVTLLEPLITNILPVGESKETSMQFYYQDESSEVRKCYEIFRSKLGEFKKKVDTNNKPLLIVILPSKINFVQSDNPQENYNKKLDKIMEICESLNLTCLNLMPLLKDEKGIFFKEGHINKQGHKQVASLLMDYYFVYNYQDKSMNKNNNLQRY